MSSINPSPSLPPQSPPPADQSPPSPNQVETPASATQTIKGITFRIEGKRKIFVDAKFGDAPICLIRPSWSTWVDLRKAIMDQIGVFVPQVQKFGDFRSLSEDDLKAWLLTLIGSYTELQALVLKASCPPETKLEELDAADVLDLVNVTLDAILIPLMDSEKNSLAPLFGAAEKWKSEIGGPAKATGGKPTPPGPGGTSSSKR